MSEGSNRAAKAAFTQRILEDEEFRKKFFESMEDCKLPLMLGSDPYGLKKHFQEFDEKIEGVVKVIDYLEQGKHFAAQEVGKWISGYAGENGWLIELRYIKPTKEKKVRYVCRAYIDGEFFAGFTEEVFFVDRAIALINEPWK